MDLARLFDRLNELSRQSVTFFEKNRICRKFYPEVANEVLQECQWLTTHGIERGMRIGILSDNSYDWIVHELSCLRLSCVLVTFSPDEFAAWSYDDLAMKYDLQLLLVSTKERTRRGEAPPYVAAAESARGDFQSRISPAARGTSLAPDVYSLVFSSGTSGKLKCILMSKRGTEELVESYGQNYRFQSSDSILVVLPLSNFQQRLMVYTAIYYGFDMQIVDSPQFFRALKEMKPTILAGPPAFYEVVENQFRNLPPSRQRILKAGGAAIRAVSRGRLRSRILRRWFAPFHEAYGGCIRLMLTGAAAIRMSTLTLFQQMGFPIYQVYGLTETGFVSWNLPGRNRPGSVGKLVFEGGASLAEDGEILVHYRYPQSIGYLDAETEQAKTYLGDRGIATGDIGRFDEDGYLYIVGRKKQIIVTQGGYKLQPEPLESEIERRPEVSRAVLFGGGELPVLSALVGLRPEAGPAADRRVQSFVDELNRTLPPASRVARVIFTDRPFTRENGFLTRNLKIDRNAIYREFRDALLGAETGLARHQREMTA
jgi:long-subunit acyl-CoA synthetase (AMP-forming)